MPAAKNMGLEVRAGVHVGEVEVGLDAAGVRARGCQGLLVGPKITLTEKGIHVLKGAPDEWQLFAELAPLSFEVEAIVAILGRS